jgi:hypothetical protein
VIACFDISGHFDIILKKHILKYYRRFSATFPFQNTEMQSVFSRALSHLNISWPVQESPT